MTCILLFIVSDSHYLVWYILLGSPLKLNNYLFHSEKIWTNKPHQNDGLFPAWRGLQRAPREEKGKMPISSQVICLKSRFISYKTNYQVTTHSYPNASKEIWQSHAGTVLDYILFCFPPLAWMITNWLF